MNETEKFQGMDVIRMDEKTRKPFVKYLRGYQSCFLCEIACPVEAIYVTFDRARRVKLPW